MAWLLFLDYQRVQSTPRLPPSNFGEANQPLNLSPRISESPIDTSVTFLGLRRAQSTPRLSPSDFGERNRPLGCYSSILGDADRPLDYLPRFADKVS